MFYFFHWDSIILKNVLWSNYVFGLLNDCHVVTKSEKFFAPVIDPLASVGNIGLK